MVLNDSTTSLDYSGQTRMCSRRHTERQDNADRPSTVIKNEMLHTFLDVVATSFSLPSSSFQLLWRVPPNPPVEP